MVSRPLLPLPVLSSGRARRSRRRRRFALGGVLFDELKRRGCVVEPTQAHAP